MSPNELVLIDLSSIAYPIYLMSASEPDPNHTSTKIVERVRALATGKPYAAICCDAGRSFRHEISPAYKANRPEREAALHHQIDLAREILAADGFPIWAVKGFEADDLVATATAKALALPDLDVLIVSADKDLLQLVGPRVRAMSVRDGSILDSNAVLAKFGVYPSQMRDYLMLVGDASDNVKGAQGIGPKKAAALLAKYDTLDKVYQDLAIHGSAFQPALATALHEFRGRLADVQALITLRADVEIAFEEISVERVPKEVAAFAAFDVDEPEPTPIESKPREVVASVVPATPVETAVIPPAAPTMPSVPNGGDIGTSLAVREPEVMALPPAEWERQLDPRSPRDARALSKDMYDSRMFSAYGTPQAVLATIMLGRELGLPAMASLRGINNIEGKHALSAALMVALVLKSGLADYFEPISFDDKQATFETKRKGARNPVTLTHTIEMATLAGLVKQKSNWERIPTEMLMARAQARLARLVYPDLLAGLYTPDELTEIRTAAA